MRLNCHAQKSKSDGIPKHVYLLLKVYIFTLTIYVMEFIAAHWLRMKSMSWIPNSVHLRFINPYTLNNNNICWAKWMKFNVFKLKLQFQLSGFKKEREQGRFGYNMLALICSIQHIRIRNTEGDNMIIGNWLSWQ